MKAFGNQNSNRFCCSTAAAGFSACNIPILDTAIFLVVSICVLCLRIMVA